MQVSDHGVLVMELGSGLSFPASEYLSHVIHTQALQGKDLMSCFCSEDTGLCLVYPPPLFEFSLSFTFLSQRVSPRVSSAVGGPGLPSCQHRRLHSDQRAQGPAETVQTTRSATSLFQIAGMLRSSNRNATFAH